MGYNFQLPLITDLTIDQQAVLNEPQAIAVSGGPGTGKSVVGLWRHIRNYDTGMRKSLLLTYTKSLERFLAETCRTKNAVASNNVNRTYWWKQHLARPGYDEIIVDEAQDVSLDTYDFLKRYASAVSYTTDDNQILFPENCSYSRDLQNKFRNRSFTLSTNFRNTRQITRFVRSIQPDKVIQDGLSNGPVPQLIHLGNDTGKQLNAILEIISTYSDPSHNIAILDPFTTNVNNFYNKLTANGIRCTKYVNEQEQLHSIERVHVTTFKSCKGLEFNTVIVPNMHSYNFWLDQHGHLVSEKDIYVVLTRSKNNVFLMNNSHPYYQDENLEFLEMAIERGTIEEESF